MIQEQAMLISLNISQWTARRYDKAASVQVDNLNEANNAGRYNKRLLPKDALTGIDRAVSAARTYHYDTTMPWGDNGDRLLPSKLFFKYRERIQVLFTQFDREVDNFVNLYPDHVANARKTLGKMYDPGDYPGVRDVRRRFNINFSITPVPSANDFRVDVGLEDAARIRESIEAAVAERQSAAVKDCWERARKVVEKMRERLVDEKAVFRDSLVSNVQDLVDILPAMNITNDPELAALCKRMSDDLLIPPQRLRDDGGLRAETARRADEILAKFKL